MVGAVSLLDHLPGGLLQPRLPIRPLRAAVLAAATAFSGCSSDATGGGDGVEEDPHLAPAAVTDLRVVETTPTTATLAWTAPVASETHGYVHAYDIRYTTTEPENESAWDAAVQLGNEPGPAPGGQEQVWTVTDLQYGQTYYFGMKCQGEGPEFLWSGISNIAAATLPIDFEISVPDPNLETVLRSLLGKPTGALMYSDLLTFTELEISGGGIASVSGLEHCENLVILRATDNALTDLSPLANLQNLEALDLVVNQISDVGPLATLTKLTQLHLGQNVISDISSLSSLTALTVLRVHANNIVDIGAVQPMTQLEWLSLTGNAVTDLTALVNNSGIGQGDIVELHGNPLSETAINVQIPALQARGVDVRF